mgnify:FL=1
MNGTQNLNIDSKTLDQCLKTISNFGSTTYQNICTGDSYIVSWGSIDWMKYIFMAVILLAMFSFFVKLLVSEI